MVLKKIYNGEWREEGRFLSEQVFFLGCASKDFVDTNPNFRGNVYNLHCEYTSDPSEADLFVYHKKADKDFPAFVEEFKKYKKPIYALYNDDLFYPTPCGSTVFQTSEVFNSKYVLPPFFNDIHYRYVENKNYIHREAPIVGFCGALTSSFRKMVLEEFEKNKFIHKNFLIRDKFWNGEPHNPTFRDEFIENIQESDLVLCPSGNGKFSYRLYETMCLGRIPVIFHDCLLPKINDFKWSEIIYEFSDFHNNHKKIKEDWKNLQNKYKIMCDLNREIYLRYLRADSWVNYQLKNL